jgi:hypothetical protein
MPRNGPLSGAAYLVALHLTIAASSVNAQPGMTYESLSDLPNFAGPWTPLTPPFVLAPARPQAARAGGIPPPPSQCALAPQFKPEVAARCRESAEARRAAGDVRELCSRLAFVGRPPAGAAGAFEILFTPGRVTMAVESGITRRIYMRSEPPAGSLDASRGGTSVGRWEGTTLVVATSGLDPNAQLVPGSTLGRDARVVERISLVDADTLRIEATLTAPAVLDAPLTTAVQYRRAPDRVFTDFETCVEGDRSADPSTGRDRFDKTPPPDLPPPPTD